jgi:predicted aspartyl protease
MVDTGAETTWLPEAELRAAGIEIFKRDQLFVMANGAHVTRHVGTARIHCGEFKTVDEVVFAQPGDLSLLGTRTLEGFNAVVDARKKRLVAARPIPAAPGSRAHPDRRTLASKLGRRVAAAQPDRAEAEWDPFSVLPQSHGLRKELNG